MKKRLAIIDMQINGRLTDQGFVYDIEHAKVEVLAIAKGYAMVRRKGCAPFVVHEKELIESDNSTNATPKAF